MKLKTRFLIIVMLVVSGLAGISGLSGYMVATTRQLKNAEVVCYETMDALRNLKRLTAELLYSETLDASFSEWRHYYRTLQQRLARLETSPHLVRLLKTENQQAMLQAMKAFWQTTQGRLDRVDKHLAAHFQQPNASRDGLIYQYFDSRDFQILAAKKSVDEAALFLGSEFESKLARLVSRVEHEIDRRMKTAIRQIVVLSILIGLSVSLILIIFFTGLNRHFMAWHKAMGYIGEGRFPSKLPVSGNDEFSQMSRAINRTSDNLKDIHAQLRQRIEELSRAKEALQEKEAHNRQIMKAKSLMRMAGAIAHKFNNHLQAVMGNLEMTIAFRTKEGEPPKALKAAMESAEKAAELSWLILTYTGKSSEKQEPMDLADYCRLNLPRFQSAMPEHIRLLTDLPAKGPLIMADSSQINLLVTHLLENACESMSETYGTVELAVKEVNAGDVTAANRFPVAWEPLDTAEVLACLEVSDEGCGIADSDMENIFDPFFSTNFTGRGMGLPVVLGIATAHHGGITVASRPGEGSVFRVFFHRY